MTCLTQKELDPNLEIELPDFNLVDVTRRLTKVHPTWPLDRVFEAVRSYLEFMKDVKLNPDENNPPVDADEVWHIHIYLDTKKYARDCQRYFGHFLHHRGETEPEDDSAFFPGESEKIDKKPAESKLRWPDCVPCKDGP